MLVTSIKPYSSTGFSSKARERVWASIAVLPVVKRGSYDEPGSSMSALI